MRKKITIKALLRLIGDFFVVRINTNLDKKRDPGMWQK